MYSLQWVLLFDFFPLYSFYFENISKLKNEVKVLEGKDLGGNNLI